MSGQLLSGNEAVARGAWEAGARVGVGYPGTPSTETLESFARLSGVRAEWAPNEKVALEVGAGVSMGGARVLVTMKHVGANVAADPLFTLAYTGVGGGLVLLVADDPGMHSSQNEQDSRNWGPFARVPVLEPSDSTEALEYTKLAFDISERFDMPVIVRSTTRISHSKGLVVTGERVEHDAIPYAKDPAKWVMMPAMARARRVDLDERVARLQAWAAEEGPDRTEMRNPDIGIITSSIAYQHVREAMPDASVLKIGLSFPTPEQAIRRFAADVDRLFVVEEADRALEMRVRALGLAPEDLPLPPDGELTPGAVARAFTMPDTEVRDGVDGLPGRPPLLCAGCPHRGLFYALRKTRAVVTGDIGCYTLAALPPLESMDSCVCMGASIGMAHGLGLAGYDDRPVVAVIGDSTFAHSGITGLAHIAYNQGASTVIILDNRTTAMTGHQGNPMMGVTLMGEDTTEIDIDALCRSMGIAPVTFVDPHDIKETTATLREEIARDELSVVVSKAPCALLLKEKDQPYAVDDEACTACGACIKIGCPAISRDEGGRAIIDTTQCVGCAQCVQLCTYDAIVLTGPACDIGRV